MVTDVLIKVCIGMGSFTTLKDYVLARRKLSASELKGVGSDSDVGIIYWKYQENVEINSH